MGSRRIDSLLQADHQVERRGNLVIQKSKKTAKHHLVAKACFTPISGSSHHQELLLKAAYPSQGDCKVRLLITAGVGLQLTIGKPHLTSLATEHI